MEIKEAAEKHIPGMTRLWMEFMYFNSAAEPYDTKGQNVLSQVANHFKSKIKSPDSLLLVALESDNVVGYSYSEVAAKSALDPDVTVGYIYDMAVTPQYRKKGIGREMLERIRTWFRSRNVREIELSAITRKIIDKSFWEKQGFNC